MGSFSGVYTYNQTFYTGTLIQPDTLSIFTKKEKDQDFLICNEEPVANMLGKCVPFVGSCTGIARIVKSVKAIFQNLSKSDASEPNPLWNAFKNLFRGIAEAFPFSGIFLILFDAVRNSVIIHSKITKEIKEQKNIAGIAIDGKVIMTVDVTQLDNCLKSRPNPKSDKERLAIFKELTFGALKSVEPFSSAMTLILPLLKDRIEVRANKA